MRTKKEILTTSISKLTNKEKKILFNLPEFKREINKLFLWCLKNKSSKKSETDFTEAFDMPADGES